jgi:hypothetical protein
MAQRTIVTYCRRDPRTSAALGMGCEHARARPSSRHCLRTSVQLMRLAIHGAASRLERRGMPRSGPPNKSADRRGR